MAENVDDSIQFFDKMGLYRLLYMVDDPLLLKSLSDDLLSLCWNMTPGMEADIWKRWNLI